MTLTGSSIVDYHHGRPTQRLLSSAADLLFKVWTPNITGNNFLDIKLNNESNGRYHLRYLQNLLNKVLLP